MGISQQIISIELGLLPHDVSYLSIYAKK